MRVLYPSELIHQAVAGGRHVYKVQACSTQPEQLPSAFQLPLMPLLPEDTEYDDSIDSAVPVWRSISGHLLVRPLINGKDSGGYMILDTGASGFVITQSAAVALGLASFGELYAASISGKVQTQFVRAHTWTLGPISIQQPVMMTMTLDGLVRGGPMDGDVIGITGYDLFRRAVVQLPQMCDAGVIQPALIPPRLPISAAAPSGAPQASQVVPQAVPLPPLQAAPPPPQGAQAPQVVPQAAAPNPTVLIRSDSEPSSAGSATTAAAAQEQGAAEFGMPDRAQHFAQVGSGGSSNSSASYDGAQGSSRDSSSSSSSDGPCQGGGVSEARLGSNPGNSDDSSSSRIDGQSSSVNIGSSSSSSSSQVETTVSTSTASDGISQESSGARFDSIDTAMGDARSNGKSRGSRRSQAVKVKRRMSRSPSPRPSSVGCPQYTMHLYNPGEFNSAAVQGWQWHPFSMISNLPHLEVTFETGSGNRTSSLFMLDTGACGSDIMLHARAIQELQMKGLGRSTTQYVRGVGGSTNTRVEMVDLPWIEVAGVRCHKVKCLYAKGISGLDISIYSAGILGGDLLARFEVIIDYARKRLGIRKQQGSC
mmetsp:Transcript_4215/g.11372  ORF Transcript_4215/g.11372 Transcript_4215/m.11372 type:complete len:593 (+) Transcript_4215:139-1917(+)